MSKPPLFTVIIPVYNRAYSIQPTLLSVLRQTFIDFECLIIDDGSKDGEALTASINTLDDPRIKLIRQENAGGGAARNTGIFSAKGRYVAFLDSDDLFIPEKLAGFATVVEDRMDLAWYSQTLVDRGVEKMWARPSRAINPTEDMGEYLFVSNEFIQTSTIVLSTQLARAVLFDPSLRKGQDLDFCLRLHSKGVRFQMLETPFSIWTDRTEVGRTSHAGGYAQVLQWLEGAKPLLTQKAEAGYRCTVLAYYIASHHPLRAIGYIAAGWHSGVPTRIAVRQLLRCFVPRRYYRKLVDYIVRIKGLD